MSGKGDIVIKSLATRQCNGRPHSNGSVAYTVEQPLPKLHVIKALKETDWQYIHIWTFSADCADLAVPAE
jgi:hypothetical protein